MRLKDTGLTVQDIKDKVNKYMIETYERFDFLAETAEGNLHPGAHHPFKDIRLLLQ